MTSQSGDEPFAQYGLLARTIAIPDDRSFVRYALDPEARWHDGKPVTPEDVVWSFDTLKEKGSPLYRYYYQNVAKAEQTGDLEVTFTFSGGFNRELPLIVGQLVVLPKHWFEGRAFEKPSLEPPLGSGPYKVVAVDAGRSIALERVADYWAAKRPVNRGRYNFDKILYDYYRDTNVALEAFKAGRYDLRCGEHRAPVGHRLRWSRARAEADRQGGVSRQQYGRDAGLGLQYPQARSSTIPG